MVGTEVFRQAIEKVDHTVYLRRKIPAEIPTIFRAKGIARAGAVAA
jgi:hypothetical protein